MYAADPIAVSSFCFAHQYRRVGIDMTRQLLELTSPADGDTELGDSLWCPDPEYPPRLWGETVIHAFRSLLDEINMDREMIDELAAWQLADPNRPPIRWLAPEALESFKRLYPKESEASRQLRALQTIAQMNGGDETTIGVAPVGMASLDEKLMDYIERAGGMLWQTQQSFSILFYNFLLHHDVFSISSLRK